jgi:hypothetical protein
MLANRPPIHHELRLAVNTMIRKRRLCLASTLATFLFAATAVDSQETPTPQFDSAAIETETGDLGVEEDSGGHHRHLERFVGIWTGRITIWTDADSEPIFYESTAEARWILGRRYLEWTHSGLLDGVPFRGLGIDGFNTVTGRYESVWIDNLGTLILYYVGSCSDGGRVRSLETTFTEPAVGRAVTQRVVYTWVNDDLFSYESFVKQGNSEHRTMLVEYQRQ